MQKRETEPVRACSARHNRAGSRAGEPALSLIFVSYRRDDAGKTAWRLFDWLERQFGEARVFFDREGIQPGTQFPQVLEQKLADCQTLIALIGPRWTDISDAQGQLRLWTPGDYVAHEVATGLERNIRVIPVLCDGARMPSRAQLPPRLTAFADCQGLSIDDAHFREDFERLVDVIEQRPRHWGERQRGRALRLVRYLKRASIVLPLIAPLIFFAAWVRLFAIWGIDTQIASHTLRLSERLTPVAREHRVAVVALDEQTERELGRNYDGAPAWRAEHARLVDRLSRAGAAAVAFDFFFERETDFDSALADAVKLAGGRGTQVVFGARAIDNGTPRLAGALLESGAQWGALCIGHKRGYLFTAPLARALPQSGQGAASECKRADTPALALAAVFAANPVDVCTASRSITLASASGRVSHLAFSEMQHMRSTPAHCPALGRQDDVATSLLVLSPLEYWRQPPQRYSYAELLKGPLPADGLAGKTVIVGVTTVAARDVHIVERGLRREERFGVELHADALRNLLAGFTVQPLVPSMQFALMFAFAILGACARFLTLDAARVPRAAVLGGLLVAYLGLVVVLSSLGMLLNPMYDIVAFALAYWILGWLERRADSSVRARPAYGN